MSDLSFEDLLLVMAMFAVFTYPLVRIIRRTGRSGWWVLALMTPVLTLITLYVFAFVRWPAIDGDRQP
jgi:ATP/ADP translocase